MRNLQDWFDGLRTRQFVHHFRDQHFGTISIDELLTWSTPFTSPANELSGMRSDLVGLIYGSSD